MPRLLAGLDEGVEQRVRTGGRSHRKEPVAAVELVAAAMMPLRPPEVGQHPLVGPAPQSLLRPAVVVQAVAPGIDHPVDGRGSAQHLAPRPGDAAARHVWLGLGGEAPVAVAAHEQPSGHHRHPEHRVPVSRAGLDQKHPVLWLGGQAVGQHATGRSGAHHDVVERPSHLAGRRGPDLRCGTLPLGLGRAQPAL